MFKFNLLETLLLLILSILLYFTAAQAPLGFTFTRLYCLSFGFLCACAGVFRVVQTLRNYFNK